jgi:cytochrome c553
MRPFLPAASTVCLSVLAACSSAAEVAAVDAAEYSADDFASCAACHLADGAGIPGAFPKVRNRAASMAALDGGRDYLIAVVSSGLMGPVTADGMNYSGVMPGQQGALSMDAIAAALNHLVMNLVDDAAKDIAAFSADEVAKVQQAHEPAGPMTAAGIRQELVEQHGEKWPQ